MFETMFQRPKYYNYETMMQYKKRENVCLYVLKIYYIYSTYTCNIIGIICFNFRPFK